MTVVIPYIIAEGREAQTEKHLRDQMQKRRSEALCLGIHTP